jgi:serine protease Do
MLPGPVVSRGEFLMMRHTRVSLVAICLAVGTAGGYYLNVATHVVRAEANAPLAVAKEPASYRDVVKSVVPAVVSIESRANIHRGGRDRNVELGLGSGVIVDPKGVILTNYHVIDGADFVDVHLTDGRVFSSKDIVGDKKTDLAIVGIKADKALPFLALGDSDKMEVGDQVLAVGAPFGLANSVTHGIISAKSRNLKINMYEDFLQTDAAINPGNSGGPLISLDGKVIGINSAIQSRSGGFQGVGLAVSSNLTRTIMDQLLKDGAVHRGYLGVQIRDVDAEVAGKLKVKEHAGVLITKVFTDSPGAKGGLKVGDIVTTVGDKAVHDGSELQKAVLAMPVGKPAEVSLIRDGEVKATKIVVEEQPAEYGYTKRNNDE